MIRLAWRGLRSRFTAAESKPSVHTATQRREAIQRRKRMSRQNADGTRRKKRRGGVVNDERASGEGPILRSAEPRLQRVQ